MLEETNNDNNSLKVEDAHFNMDKEKNKAILISMLSNGGFNIPLLIQESFLGYKYRKRNNKLYEYNATVATHLIKLYYGLNPSDIEFDTLKKNFISRYVKNESEIEGVSNDAIHGKEEIAGLGDMYEYLHSQEFDESFSLYSLTDLNQKLFGRTPFPEYAGRYRTFPVYLRGSKIGLCEDRMIIREMNKLRGRIDYLHELAKVVKDSGNTDELLNYLDQVVELNCKLIWIHPFSDGNGRTVRAFINKLLEDAGLPPIYIKANERTEYHTAMNLAIGQGYSYDYDDSQDGTHDYTAIKAFYKYKICDSIIELDINSRLKKSDQEMNISESHKKKIKKDKKDK